MKKIILSILSITLGISVQAQDKMTPELLWKLGRVSLDAANSNGEFIYGITKYDLEKNKGNRDLYLQSATEMKRIKLTDSESGEYDGQFIGDKIGYSKGGQFYLANKDGSEAKQITNIENGISGVKAFAQKDGSITLLFSVDVPMQPKENVTDYSYLPEADFKVIDDLMYRHWDHWNDDMVSHVGMASYKGAPVTAYLDPMTGQNYESPVPPFGGAESYTLSPDGKTIVYETKTHEGVKFAKSTNTNLFAYNIPNGTTTLLTANFKGYDKNPVFSADGSKLAWLSMATDGYESDVNDLIIMDFETKEVLHVLKSANLYDDLTFQSFAWADNSTLYAGVPTEGTNQIFEVRLPKQLNGKARIKALTDGQFNYNHFEIAGNSIICERQDMNHATELFAINPKNGKAIQRTHANDDIYTNLSMSKIEKRMVPTSDGEEMLTWVIYPPNFDPSKKYPTLLYCQGGPQSQVSQFYSFRWNFQLMASMGYIVVAPNRRGLPGFGREWNEKISGDWGGQSMRDYLAAIDDVAKEPYVDRNNLGCIGASYGGYSVYYLAGIHENRFSAFISHCGLFDLENWYLTTEEIFFANKDLGGPYWDPENKETYQNFDPKDLVQNWDTPIMVIHGGKDFRVPEAQGMAAFQAAQLRGIPSKFLYFPNEGHWVLSPQNGLVWHDQFFSWLDQWLKK